MSESKNEFLRAPLIDVNAERKPECGRPRLPEDRDDPSYPPRPQPDQMIPPRPGKDDPVTPHPIREVD